MVGAIRKDVTRPYGEFIGVAKFSTDTVPALVKEMEQVARIDLDTSCPKLIQRLIEDGHHVQILATDRIWSDIDFPSDLEEARRSWGT
jgi:choline kinase